MQKLFIFIFLMIVISSNGQKIIVQPGEPNAIKHAVAIADRYDTVYISTGIYKEININITKPLTIIGDNNVIIDGEKKGQIFDIVADSVTIKNLTIKNVGISHTTDYSAVRVANCKHFYIENLTIQNMFFGVYLAKASHGQVLNCTIAGDAVDQHNSGNGIHLWQTKNVEIKGNTISNTRDGIYFEFADSCLISNNFSFDNLRYGLHFMFSNNDDYFDNIFENNGAGVAVMYSRNINMKNNIFRKNWGAAAYGLLLKEIYDAEIEDNLFSKNTTAIQVDGTTRINYKRNDFRNNGWAVRVNGASYANIFKNNNFIGNSFDLSYNSNINDNKFNHNYWGSYTGYDLDNDGIGDIPYRPVNLFGYIVGKTPEAVLLLRSLFVNIINFSEKVSPIFVPVDLVDESPQMKPN